MVLVVTMMVPKNIVLLGKIQGRSQKVRRIPHLIAPIISCSLTEHTTVLLSTTSYSTSSVVIRRQSRYPFNDLKERIKKPIIRRYLRNPYNVLQISDNTGYNKGHKNRANYSNPNTAILCGVRKSHAALVFPSAMLVGVIGHTTGTRHYFSSFNHGESTSKESKNKAARAALGLNLSDKLTYKRLRQSYFEGAKQLHPDSDFSKKRAKEDPTFNPSDQFLALTEAYEFLLKMFSKNGIHHDDGFEMSREEEISYRKDCFDQLGTSAELIEEMKRDGMFLEWLKGKTDAAYAWRMFFMMNGGMAPKKLQYGVIESGGGGVTTKTINAGRKETVKGPRRRRPREMGVSLPGRPSALAGVRGRQ